MVIPVYRLPPAAVAELAAQAAGDHEPVAPRDAASVVLMRDGAAGPELYFLKRHASMAFAPGMAVFPGGSVDASDADAVVEWAGPSPAEWAVTLGTTESAARGLVIAAVRELFEETGVLLADVPDREDPQLWEKDRRRLEAHELSFAELLTRRGLAVRTDLLKAWANWITPEFERRRYATWFFVAQLPAGQSALGVSTEAQSVVWSAVGDAIASADAGELLLLPPQRSICGDLSRYRSVAEIVAAEPDLTAVRPQVAHDADGAYLVLPA